MSEYTLVIAGTQSASGPGFLVLTSSTRGGRAAARLDVRRARAVMRSMAAGELPAEPSWLIIGRELRAIAQIGLTFCRDPFDRQRFERIRELAASLIAEGSGRSARHCSSTFAGETGYATPKVDVRAAAFSDGRVLLVREISDGAWTLPGGWADVNQSAAECVVARSRRGIRLPGPRVKLAAVYDYRKRNRPHHLDSIYKMFFICELIGGSARASIETSEASFFARDALPPLSVGRTTAAQIERMFQHAENPQLPTDFD